KKEGVRGDLSANAVFPSIDRKCRAWYFRTGWPVKLASTALPITLWPRAFRCHIIAWTGYIPLTETLLSEPPRSVPQRVRQEDKCGIQPALACRETQALNCHNECPGAYRSRMDFAPSRQKKVRGLGRRYHV